MASPDKPSTATQKNFNAVANDNVWKAHIKYEQDASKLWPHHWGFLRTSYKDLVKDDFPKKSLEKIELPPSLTIPPVTPISRYIKVGRSPPVPQTTSGQIGWRSSRHDCILERYGRYAKPKGGLIKQLNWPAEAID